MQMILAFMRKLVAISFVLTAAYFATIFFIIPEQQNPLTISDSKGDAMDDIEAEDFQDHDIELVENNSIVSDAALSTTTIVTGISASSCMLGKLHNQLINNFLRGEDYSAELTQMLQIKSLPKEVVSWLMLLEEYQQLMPEIQEVFSLDQGVWGWLFAKTLRITIVNDHVKKERELYNRIIETMPLFNDFVFNRVYPKGCTNVYN